MKRFATAALAAATFIAPLGIANTASAHDNGRHGGWDRHDHGRDHDRYDDRGRYDDRRDHWDARRYNGYWRNNQFYYGPPPQAYYGHVRYDYRDWRRGDRLPSYYRDRYRVVDYRSYRVAPPPRGYHYVRDDDRGSLLLVGITTGVILGAILASN